MEPIKVSMKVRKVTWSYVIGHYLMFIVGIICIAYSLYHLVNVRDIPQNTNLTVFLLFIGGIGIAKGGKVVYGQKIVRRKR